MEKKQKYELPQIEEIKLDTLGSVLEGSGGFGTSDYTEQPWDWGN